MKKKLVGISTGFVLLGIVGMAQASLTTIGTATYNGSDYNLIWDDDNNGNSVVWLDYTHPADIWLNQVNWASGLGSQLTVTLNPLYTTDIDWTTGWRLPNTVDDGQMAVLGFEGDPNGDGDYSYTAGYNLPNSEMGHLFYTELGNAGYQNTDGSWNTLPPAPDYFLQKTEDFEHLNSSYYWSGTEYAATTSNAWYFRTQTGYQHANSPKSSGFEALAIRSGEISVVPVPGAVWLLGSGLAGLVGLRRKMGKK